MTMSRSTLATADAARMTCSNSERLMPDRLLQSPEFARGKDASEGRVLSESLPFIGLGGHHSAHLLDRSRKNCAPLRVASKQPGAIGVPPGPPLNVGAREVDPLRAIRQLRRDPSRQFKAHPVSILMCHECFSDARLRVEQSHSSSPPTHDDDRLELPNTPNPDFRFPASRLTPPPPGSTWERRSSGTSAGAPRRSGP